MDMDDNQVREMVRLIWLYISEFGPESRTVEELVEDATMSLDVTTDEDDERRRYVSMAYSHADDTRTDV